MKDRTTGQPRPDNALAEQSPPGWTPRLGHRLLAPFRCLPDFLVIGAQKAGTTSLTGYLDRNPAAWITPGKETGFLSGPRRSANAYRAFFPTAWTRRSMSRRAGRRVLLGEGTPYDLFHPRAAEEAVRILGRPRVVVLLRDPVARAHSHHRHCVSLGLEELGFEEAIAAEPERLAGEAERLRRDPTATSHHLRHHSYVARGHYAGQLRRWRDAIGADRVHVELSEALFASPEEPLRRIEAFLELPAGKIDDFGHRNRGAGGPPISKRIESELRSFYSASNQELAELLGHEPPWPG